MSNVGGETVFLKKERMRSKSDEPTARRRDGDDDDDDDEFSLVTVASSYLQESIGSALTASSTSAYANREDEVARRTLRRRGRVFSYRRKKATIGDGIFSAPAGVCPRRVTSSIIRRNTGDSRLVFVWPQKANGGRFTTVFAPLLRALLTGLLIVDALHLWPGEFLPTSLPSIVPIALSPIKCNVIEPQWLDNN